MIAFPDAGDVRADTAVALVAAAIRCPAIRAVVHHSSPRVPAARNQLVREFLASGLEWLWFVDTDMTFAPDALETLLGAADPEERPVVGGLCFGLDGLEVHSTLMRKGRDGITYDLALTWPPDQLVEVDATGAACLLIHRGLLERLRAACPAPHHWFADEVHAGIDVGHDLVFCERVKALGARVFVHTGVRVGHLKTTSVDVDAYRRWITRQRFLVTGTGRCGTGYLAQLLTRLGLPTGHEQVYHPGNLATGEFHWNVERGEASWLAAPFLAHFQGDAVHLVRHPLDVIGSFAGIGFFERRPGDPGYEYTRWAYVGAGLEPPADEALDPAGRERLAVARATAHYVRWNRLIERHARWRFRIEDLDVAGVRVLTELLGAPRREALVRGVLASLPRDVNTRARREVGWGDVPDDVRGELASVARDYGYDAPDDCDALPQLRR